MFKDKIDEKIVEYLKADSRMSFVDIGDKLNLAESAVRRRIKIMVDRGIIKRFTIEMGEENTTSALVLVSVESATDTSKVSKKIAGIEGVKTVYEITGRYDIAAIISAPHITEVNSGVDKLRKVPGVDDTNTVMVLKKVL